MAELNVNLHHMRPFQHWKERFRGFSRHHANWGTNRHALLKTPRLFGGTAIITMAPISRMVHESGEDASGLGRWVWTSYKGKNNSILRIVSIYRPVRDTNANPGTVYSQQEAYLLQHNDDRCPRKALLDDLRLILEEWITQGNNIIVGMDANENVRIGDTHRLMTCLGLDDAHAKLHADLPMVATCAKNTHSIPVDAMWCSPALTVTQAGYGGFQQGSTTSDHRLLWIDVHLDTAVGYTPSANTIQPTQRLHLKDPRVVRKYNRVVKKQHERHRLRERLFRLQQTTDQFSEDDINEYNVLVQIDNDARCFATKKCRKLNMGQVPFSDTIQQHHRTIEYWSLGEKLALGNKVCRHKLDRLAEKIQPDLNVYACTLPQIQQYLKEARRAYRKDKKNAASLREAFLERLHREQAAQRKMAPVSLAKSQLTAERQRRTARRVKEITGNTRAQSFSMLDAPCLQDEPINEEGNMASRHTTGRKLCMDSKDIEQACMDEGRRRYTQVYDTPFLQNPLRTEVGLLGLGAASQDILHGRYSLPQGLDEFTCKFIGQLYTPSRYLNQPPVVQSFLSTEDHVKGWKRMRPTTQSDPSAPGFLDLIAASYDCSLADIDATFASIPLMASFIPPSWARAVDVMIPKKASSIEVEKLRIIVLFNALFNMINKRVGRTMMAAAEFAKVIPDEAYGSRKNRRAAECALNKVLTLDLHRTTHQPAILCSNDAKSCYDRIVHSVASLCMQRLGVPPDICKVMFGTLQAMQHQVRTTFGDSRRTYGCVALDQPLQGILQGNGAGPAIWLVVSMPLIEMMKAEGYGFHFETCFTQEQLHFVCYTFVDDTDLIQSGHMHNGIDSLLGTFQEAVDHWEGGLRATGGALVPSKSHWSALYYTWTRDRWKMHDWSDSEQATAITIRSIEGTQRELLEYIGPHEAKETLGIWVAMDGKSTAQFTALKSKATEWADKIRVRQLTPYEIWFSLNQCILKSIDYPLMTTCLSEAQCKAIMRPLLQASLPHLHLQKSFPRAVLHGGILDGGIGIPNLWDLQGILKLWVGMKHGNDSSITGQLIRANLQQLQFTTGLGTAFWKLPFKPHSVLVSNSWFQSLWRFLDGNQEITLDIPSSGFEPQCEGDTCLMSWFLQQKQWGPSELNSLSICRRWLRVIYLSDVVDGKGTHLLESIREASYQQVGASSRPSQWDHQGKPAAFHWKIWREALEPLTLTPTSLRLKTPLGPWHSTTKRHGWWLFASDNLVVNYNENPPVVFQRVSGRTTRTQRYYRLDDPSVDLHQRLNIMPGDRTVPLPAGSRIISTTGTRGWQSPPQPPPLTRWWAPFLSGPPSQALLDSFEAGTLVAICDGSCKNGRGTAAFVIQCGDDDSDRVIGCNCTPGSFGLITPYRTELMGTLALTFLLTDWATTYDLSNPRATIGCDCLSALDQTFGDTKVDPTAADFDLLCLIREKLVHSPVSWEPYHIHGHQDDHQQYSSLTWQAQLNVQMDSLAKMYWNQNYGDTDSPEFDAPSEGDWIIKVNERRIHSWDRTTLLQTSQHSQIATYWTDKYQWRQDQISSINWEALRHALQRLPVWDRIRTAKWRAHRFPTCSLLSKWFPDTDESCPHCTETETQDHVLQCGHAPTRNVWTAELHKLKQWGLQQQTQPLLLDLLCKALDCWIEGSLHVLTPDISNREVQPVYDQQQALGWGKMFYGFWGTQWAIVQQNHYESIGSRKTGVTWLSRIIRRVWKIAWALWAHRCQLRHDPHGAFNLALSRRLNQEIQNQYEEGFHEYRLADQRWGRIPLATLLNEPTAVKQAWLVHVRIMRARHLRRNQPSLRDSRAILRRYFPSLP